MSGTDVVPVLERRVARSAPRDPRVLYRAALDEASREERDALGVASSPFDRAQGAVVLGSPPAPPSVPNRHTDDREADPGAMAPEGTAHAGRGSWLIAAAMLAVLVGLVASLAWRSNDRARVVSNLDPDAVHFGPTSVPDGFVVSAYSVRSDPFSPVAVTAFESPTVPGRGLYVVTSTGQQSVVDAYLPDSLQREVVGRREVVTAEQDRVQSGLALVAWAEADGREVLVAARGLDAAELRAAAATVVVDADGTASVPDVPSDLAPTFRGDASDDSLVVTAYVYDDLVLEPAGAATSPEGLPDRQLRVRTFPGATFDIEAVRWRTTTPITEVTLPDGTTAYRIDHEHPTWIKQLPDGVAKISTYRIGADVDLPAFVAGVRHLEPTEWVDLLGEVTATDPLAPTETKQFAVATVAEGPLPTAPPPG